jgi:NAD(P)-dependent dehydrogenase (short-subunit alcohol dehydrogenase family)
MFVHRNDSKRRRAGWSVADAPRQDGRTAVVTGANSGVGFETAKALAGLGATVLLACRNKTKAHAAADAIRQAVPGAQLDVISLDTSDLSSVRSAAADIRHRTAQLDILINNAGAAFLPHAVTAEGVESQFATNFLGHYALTGLLIDPLLAAEKGRVVSLTSLAHLSGRLRLDALACAQRYNAFGAYAQSKLSMLLFTRELQRRLQQASAPARALAAHPGGSRSDLLRNGLDLKSVKAGPALLQRLFMLQSAQMGALPSLRAALDPLAAGGQCYAPNGWFEFTGPPSVGRTSKRSRDPQLALLLWQTAEQLTDVKYPLPA